MALLKQRLSIDARTRPGKAGQFEVRVDGEVVARRGESWLTRLVGGGYPDLERVVDQIRQRLARGGAGG